MSISVSKQKKDSLSEICSNIVYQHLELSQIFTVNKDNKSCQKRTETNIKLANDWCTPYITIFKKKMNVLFFNWK